MAALMAVITSMLGIWLLVNLVCAFIVGALAKKLLPGKEDMGWGKTILLGFLGGIAGKIIFGLLGWSTGLVMGFIASIVGAFVLLVLYQTFMVKKAKPA